jgi:uncharacterized membrane protein
MFGIPISLFGILAYLTFLTLAYLGLKKKIEARTSLLIIFIMALLGEMYAGYLVYIMLYVLEAICPWCFVSHVILTLIIIISFLQLLKFRGKSK